MAKTKSLVVRFELDDKGTPKIKYVAKELAHLKQAIQNVVKTQADMEKGGSRLSSVLGSTARSVGSFMQSFTGLHFLVGDIARATQALGKFLDLGSQAQLSANQFKFMFGTMSQSVDKWAKDFSSSVGRSYYSIRADMGKMQRALAGGFVDPAKAAEYTKALLAGSFDISAVMTDITQPEIFKLLSQGMTGSVEGLRKLGFEFSEINIKTEAIRMGLLRVGQELTQEARVAGALALTMQTISEFAGQYKEHMGEYPFQIQKIKDAWADFKKDVASGTLPMMTELINSSIGTAEINRKAILEGVLGVVRDIFIIIDTAMPTIKSAAESVKDLVEMVKQAQTNWNGFIDKIKEFGTVKPGISSTWTTTKEDKIKILEGQLRKDEQGYWDALAAEGGFWGFYHKGEAEQIRLRIVKARAELGILKKELGQIIGTPTSGVTGFVGPTETSEQKYQRIYESILANLNKPLESDRTPFSPEKQATFIDDIKLLEDELKEKQKERIERERELAAQMRDQYDLLRDMVDVSRDLNKERFETERLKMQGRGDMFSIFGELTPQGAGGMFQRGVGMFLGDQFRREEIQWGINEAIIERENRLQDEKLLMETITDNEALRNMHLEKQLEIERQIVELKKQGDTYKGLEGILSVGSGLRAVTSTFNDLNEAAATFFGEGSAQAKAFARIAIITGTASAIVDSIAGWMALTKMMPALAPVAWGLGSAQVAAIAALGGAQMAQVDSIGAKYHSGGMVTASGKRDVPIIAQEGEVVLSREASDMLMKGSGNNNSPVIVGVFYDEDSLEQFFDSRKGRKILARAGRNG